MPLNNPQAYAAPGAAPAPAPPQAAPPVPAPPVAGVPGAAPGGTLEQQVIEGYMSLTPVEKKVLLTAMDGVLGQILIKVMPDELEEVFLEAVNTSPEQIVGGTTPPRAAAKYAQAAPAGPPQAGPPVPPVSPQGPSTSLAGQQFRR